MQPIVTLVSSTPDPMEVIYILWERSKTDQPTPLDVATVKRDVPKAKLEQLFWQVLRQHIPIAEQIHFTFMLDGISISLREQMVRHRIGTAVGGNYGVDTIPDLATSSWWSQSMRIQDMSTFADRRMFRIPETIREQGPVDKAGHTAIGLYLDTMEQIQAAYKALVAAGVPMEDARELIPLGAQHSISWDLNLQSLLHILGKRGCWILQGSIWSPIILGMLTELATKIHPMFHRIIAPPCIDATDGFQSCQYRLENARRMTQQDQHPPCPLWLTRDEDGADKLLALVNDPERLTTTAQRRERLINADDLVPRHREMKQRADEYQKLWGADPYDWSRPVVKGSP
jgi:thymidylate synthase (FAD)